MRSGSARHSHRRGQRGFGYLLVLFALAAMGLLLGSAGQVWHTAAQREKEAELLFIGNQFRQAIGSYYASSPDATKDYPLKLEDLLEDQRFPVPHRHLRQLYRDPITGSAQWGLVKVGDRIAGIHSLSESQALKTAFVGPDSTFSGATRYEQWVFRFEPGEAVR